MPNSSNYNRNHTWAGDALTGSTSNQDVQPAEKAEADISSDEARSLMMGKVFAKTDQVEPSRIASYDAPTELFTPLTHTPLSEPTEERQDA